MAITTRMLHVHTLHEPKFNQFLHLETFATPIRRSVSLCQSITHIHGYYDADYIFYLIYQYKRQFEIHLDAEYVIYS